MTFGEITDRLSFAAPDLSEPSSALRDGLKEVNGLTARLTVTLACATKSSGNLRFTQEIDRRQIYGLAVIVVASFGGLNSMETHSEALKKTAVREAWLAQSCSITVHFPPQVKLRRICCGGAIPHSGVSQEWLKIRMTYGSLVHGCGRLHVCPGD